VGRQRDQIDNRVVSRDQVPEVGVGHVRPGPHHPVRKGHAVGRARRRGHTVAAVDQHPTDRPADEAGPARDENIHTGPWGRTAKRVAGGHPEGVRDTGTGPEP
jgi:hypothetical protein